MLIMAFVSTIPCITIASRLLTEEKRGRLEQVFGKAQGKTPMMAFFAATSFFLAIFFQVAAALGMWLMGTQVMDDPVDLETMVLAALSYVPAIVVFAGLSVFFTSSLPKLFPVVWAYFGFTFVTSYLGEMLNLPEWMSNVTPFGLLPRYPMEDAEPLLMALWCAVAIALAACGAVLYRSRDIRCH
jgi:ABC-2 type transport system permease protein